MPKHIGKHAAEKPKRQLNDVLLLPTHKLGLFLALPAVALSIPLSGSMNHDFSHAQEDTSTPQTVQTIDYKTQKALTISSSTDPTVEKSVVTAAKAPKPKATQAPAETAAKASTDAKEADKPTTTKAKVSLPKSHPYVERSERSNNSDSSDNSSETNDSSSDNSTSDVRSNIIAEARKHLGLRYVYGGVSPVTGFDCSGYTQYVLRKAAGVSIPRTSGEQRGAGHVVSQSEAKPGDLVWMPGHVGIYAGNGKMYHSPHTGSSVKLAKIWRPYTVIRVIND